MLYIQKSVSENAGIAVIGVEKCKNFPEENTSRPPTNKRDITPNFLLPTTIYHFSTLGIVWSLFVDGPPTDEFLKNALTEWVYCREVMRFGSHELLRETIQALD